MSKRKSLPHRDYLVKVLSKHVDNRSAVTSVVDRYFDFEEYIPHQLILEMEYQIFTLNKNMEYIITKYAEYLKHIHKLKSEVDILDIIESSEI